MRTVTPGPVALVVTATSGSLSQSMTTSTSQADFALSGPSQPIALAAGGTAQVSVSAAGFNGFGGQVSAALAGLPAGVTASPSTLTLTPGVRADHYVERGGGCPTRIFDADPARHVGSVIGQSRAAAGFERGRDSAADA